MTTVHMSLKDMYWQTYEGYVTWNWKQFYELYAVNVQH